MRLLRKYWLALTLTLVAMASFTSCAYSNTYFDDDEWMGSDYNGESLLLNGELEIDDYDR